MWKLKNSLGLKNGIKIINFLSTVIIDRELISLHQVQKYLTDKGYNIINERASYKLAWKPQDSKIEYAVGIANLVLSKTEELKNRIYD